MRPRALASFASTLSAALLTLLATSAARAQQAPSVTAATPQPPSRSTWVMPGSESVVPPSWIAPTEAPAPAPTVAPPVPRKAAPPPATAAPEPPSQADPEWMNLASHSWTPAAVRAARAKGSDAKHAKPAKPNPGNLPAVAVAPSQSSTPVYGFTFPTDPSSVEKPAEAPAKPRATYLDVGVGTEAPISVGGVATLETHRILLQVGAGVMPQAYAQAIDGFLTSVGAYDAVVSSVVRSSISNSFVLRTSLGVRPFSNHGFEILGGYTLLTGGGSVATADVLNAILTESGSSVQAPAGLGGDIPLSATLHNVHASIGWRWLLANDHLVIRASVSYLQTLASRIDVKIPASASVLVPYQGMINDQVNAYLGPFFAKYAKAPTLGLSAAVRF